MANGLGKVGDGDRLPKVSASWELYSREWGEVAWAYEGTVTPEEGRDCDAAELVEAMLEELGIEIEPEDYDIHRDLKGYRVVMIRWDRAGTRYSWHWVPGPKAVEAGVAERPGVEALTVEECLA